MSAAKSALRIFGVQAPPVSEAVRNTPATERAAVMARASKSVKQASELLNQLTQELAEGDLDLADLIVPNR